MIQRVHQPLVVATTGWCFSRLSPVFFAAGARFTSGLPQVGCDGS